MWSRNTRERERERINHSSYKKKKDRNEGQFKEMRDSFSDIMCYIC